MRRVLPLLCSLLLVCLHINAQKDCPATQYEKQLLAANPEIAKKLEAIESFTQNAARSRYTTLSASGSSFSLPDIITIPVVVHVLYSADAQNISDAQVQSQIDALNNDFRKLNVDLSNVPSYFAGLAADCGIQFRLAAVDSKGAPTKGIVRRKTSIENFGTDDRAKYTSKGGDDAWDATKYLNLWVCNLSGGVIGYSSVVGGPAEKDGVVIAWYAFGVGATNSSSYNKGRTATHEIGHWLNLKHIWGDTYCGDDRVDDTPPQRSANHGCPSGQNFTCGTTTNGDMYMNYMDLTNDACMYLFTYGQRERMRALFLPGGPRNSMLTSNALTSISQGALPESGAMISSGLQVYPNPATTFITIPDAAAGATFTIYSHLGQPVQHIIAKGGVTTADISKLTNGIYYLRAKDGSSTKFVKIN